MGMRTGLRLVEDDPAGRRFAIHELEGQLFDLPDLASQPAVSGDLFLRDDTAQLLGHPVVGFIDIRPC
jgi:hypothetical protein